ncbi:unnamed protein product [Pylaiella littoralis]
MLHPAGPLRAGGTRGTMEQCLTELEESHLPAAFKLAQVRSLSRYMREVAGLQRQIEEDSGFETDTTSYLEILCAKEDSDLMRRVSAVRCLKQDFDEKRLEWRKHKKNVINAIGSMTSRALRFEDKERKTIALHALSFYKNVMARDDGAIPGESESTDGLIDQYKRHRTEISRIPMYADSILKMLKDIRKTVRSSAKLQPGSNAFAQFLEEWWASVVQFLQQSSIVEAEKNAREVMQTLKKLKGKQEENKKREISRLLSMLDDNAGAAPPTGRLSELLEPPIVLPPCETSSTPEDTSAGSRAPQQQGLKRDRDGRFSEESGLSILPAAVMVGDDGGSSAGSKKHPANSHQQQQQQQQRAPFTGSGEHSSAPRSSSSSVTRSDTCTARGNASTLAGGAHGYMSSGGGCGGRPAPTVRLDGGEHIGRHGGGINPSVNPLRSPSSGGLRSPAMAVMAGVGGASFPSRVSWEEESQGTAGTVDMTDMRHGVSFSGIPDGDDGEEDDEDELFEAADNLDLGAVDLCATEADTDGQTTYRDQDELRVPVTAHGPQQKQGVEQRRFSAALDFFRQEQQSKTRCPVLALHPPSPLRSSASFSNLSSKSPRPTARTALSSPFTPKLGGAARVRTPASRTRGDGLVRARSAARRRGSADKDTTTARDRLVSANNPRSLGRSHSVYIPNSRNQTTPTHRASKLPTVKSSRRPLLSPGFKGFSRSAFFGDSVE